MIHKTDPRHPLDQLKVAIDEVTLEVVGSENHTVGPSAPVGVPLDGPGGSVLVQGERQTINLQCDPNTGDLAAGVTVVFTAPKAGEARLRVADFSPVALSWSADA
jgi:hypothetical protein